MVAGDTEGKHPGGGHKINSHGRDNPGSQILRGNKGTVADIGLWGQGRRSLLSVPPLQAFEKSYL